MIVMFAGVAGGQSRPRWGSNSSIECLHWGYLAASAPASPTAPPSAWALCTVRRWVTRWRSGLRPPEFSGRRAHRSAQGNGGAFEFIEPKGQASTLACHRLELAPQLASLALELSS